MKRSITFITQCLRNQIEWGRTKWLWISCFSSTFSPQSNQDTAKKWEPYSGSNVAHHMMIFFISFSWDEFGQYLVIRGCLWAPSTKCCVYKWGECALFNHYHSRIVHIHFCIFMYLVDCFHSFVFVWRTIRMKDMHIVK